ncbi:MAG: glycosyltransferase family 4 protein [Parcubacteria group bacterium]|nr:glycosyltransferase family 4 protein [Parcubacteria group bacterium]
MKSPKVLISGFSYAFPYYFKVWEFYPDKGKLYFILPKLWIARQGKIRLELPHRPGFNIIPARVISYGSQSLVWKLGGLLKGFMPKTILLLPYLRIVKGIKIYYHISEPHLLTTFLNALAARLCGMKYICFTWQNLPPAERLSGLKLKLSNWFVWLNLSLSHAILCGSLLAQDVIRSIKPSMRTAQIQMAGVDTERFQPAPAAEGKLAGGQTVLFFGALDERKGVDVLLRAFDQIKTDFPRAQLVIIGSGLVENKLHRLADELNLGERVQWHSWMKNEDLPRFVAQADVFVYLSRRAGGWIEQYGYAIMQASAAGLPVVATDNGSIYEVVKDGETGRLVETDSVEQTAAAIRHRLADPAAAKRMGQAGHRYINERFSHSVVAKKFADFFLTLA